MCLAICLVTIYGILLLVLSTLWSQLKDDDRINLTQNLCHVSIVIAFRNEEANLKNLVNSLRHIAYQKEKLEIHFVNDHSSDASLSILRKELSDFAFPYFLHELPESLSGKKQAQLYGINFCNHGIIITTDADCKVPAKWVKNQQALFSDPKVHMVTSNLTFEGQGFWSDLMRIELSPLLAITGLSIQFKKPILANGANMAFRKESYLKVLNNRKDMDISPSGDDIFLLEAIKNEYGNDSIKFLKKNMVLTKAPQSFKSFYFQRIRWAAKWKVNKSILAIIPAAAIWIFHLLFLLAVGYAVSKGLWVQLIFLFLPKVIGESIFISKVFKNYPYQLNWLALLFATLFYSSYVTFFGLTANFVSYKWKDRTYG